MKHVNILMALALILSFAVQEASANQPMAAVAGAVYDQDGRAVGKALVTFGVKTESRGLVTTVTMTDDEGKYRIERLPAGRGRAKVEAEDRGAIDRLVKLAPNVLNIEIFRLQ